MSLIPFCTTEQLEEMYDGETFGTRIELWRRYLDEYRERDTDDLCRVLLETFETHNWCIPLTSLDDIVRSAVMAILESRGGEELTEYLDELAAADEAGDQLADNEAFIRSFTGWFHRDQLFGPEL